MRRATVFGLAALPLLLVLFGGYTAYWLIAAARIEDGVTTWAQSARNRKIDASWQHIRVAGFPLGFRVELRNAALRDETYSPAPELRLPVLTGSAQPWDFADWRLAAQDGLSAELAGAGGRPPLKLAAQAADGAVASDRRGGAVVWLNLRDAVADAGARVRIGSAVSWIIVPAQPARRHTEPSLGIALDLRRVELPAPARAFGDNLDELAFGVTVKGALPGGKLVPAVAAWRDAGGTIELDNLRLDWGGVGASATGTIALDQDLQPMGGFSGAIEGYDRILAALVQAGRMRAGDAGLAQLALTMLAKAGPDGRPEIATSFTIQNGQMYLGPAKLGRAPRIAWE